MCEAPRGPFRQEAPDPFFRPSTGRASGTRVATRRYPVDSGAFLIILGCLEGVDTVNFREGIAERFGGHVRTLSDWR